MMDQKKNGHQHHRLLDSLMRTIQDVYEVEYEYESERYSKENGGRKIKMLSERPPSIRDLIANENWDNCIDSEMTRLDVVISWRKLAQTLHEQQVFLQYVDILESTFFSLAKMEHYLFRIQKNLVDLLKHTVENHDRDSSTECRFITLLEIARSYNDFWKPSKILQRFWMRLMQKISPTIKPIDFRRGAYGVLVSLSWVPSSKGLLEACSITESQPAPLEHTPQPVQAILAKIRDKPLPRNDSVYQILDRLKDETNVSIAISSSTCEESIGKTTLAALVASHPLIIKTFTVLWLPIKRKQQQQQNQSSPATSVRFTYARYIKLLEILCLQLSFTPEWPEPHSMLRLEEPALRQKREEYEMIRAKNVMCDFLSNTGRNVLLVMDDVADDTQIEWFRFFEKQSILVTSQSLQLSVDWTVDLDQWNEEEAIELFLLEADFPQFHVMASANEVRAIVTKCSNHPLAVRTVARWFKLKNVTAGAADGLIESNGELSSLEVLSDVLNRALSPIVKSGGSSILFKLCLLSMAAVFSEFGPVPLDSVLLLWQHLIKTDPSAVEEIGKELTYSELQRRVWIFLEGLTHLGLVLITEKGGNAYVEIYHPVYVEFALAHIYELAGKDTVEDTVAMWHKAFVTCYLSRKTESNVDNCREYAMEKLVTHMIRGKLFPKAEALLCDGRLYQARVMALGWKRGTELHAEDCMELQREMKQHGKQPEEIESLLATVMSNMAQFLSEEALRGDVEKDGEIEISKALHFIGFTLAENHIYGEALSNFKEAQKVLPKPHPFNVAILYSLSSIYLATDEYEKALKRISVGVKTLNSTEKKDVMFPGLLRLQGDALIAYCHYKEAFNHFGFIANQWKNDTFGYRIDYGLLLFQKGRLHQVMGENENAISAFHECVNWKHMIGENSRNLAAAYSILGDILIQSMQVEEARKYFEKALDILQNLAGLMNDEVEIINGVKNEASFDILMELLTGKVRFLQSDLPGNWAYYERARELILKSPVHLMDQSAYDLRFMAHAYEENDDLHTAMSLLEDALELLKDRHDSLEKALCLLEMGSYLIDQGAKMEALSCFENSVEIQILKLGECEQVLETLNLIGNVHASSGAHEEALRIYGKVLELTDKLCNDDNEKIASALYAVGEAHEGLGQNGRAQAVFTDCLEVIKRDRREDHPDVARTLQRLGTVTSSQGNFDKAYFYYTEALHIREANFGSQHVALGETLHGLGVLARKRSEFESAQEFLVDALAIWRKTHHTKETGETLLEIGHIHRLLGDSDRAMGCYMECLDMVECSKGNYDSLLSSIYLAMGNTKLSLGKDGEALRFCDRAVAIRKKILGEDHAKTANTWRSLGIVQFITNTDGALRYLHKCVKIMDGYGSYCRVDYVIAKMMLGDIHKTGGSRKLARQAWSAAKDVCTKHPEIRKEYPQIEHMVNHRILEEKKKKSPNPRKMSLFAKLQELGRLGEEELTGYVQHNPKEIAIIRQIVFLDD